MTPTEHLSLRILYKIASRGRPDWLKRTVECVKRDPYPHTVVLAVDSDDRSWEPLSDFLHGESVRVCKGESKSKVHAINRDIPLYGWDILVVVSDDMLIHKGFGEVVRRRMAEAFPDLDGVLHFPDGNRKDLLTMSIMGHRYYMRDRYVYHPSYEGQFCDDEAMFVSKKRGKYVYFDDDIFLHLHPNYHSRVVKRDGLYYKYDLLFNKDKANYERRRALDFETTD